MFENKYYNYYNMFDEQILMVSNSQQGGNNLRFPHLFWRYEKEYGKSKERSEKEREKLFVKGQIIF